jgi:hypothetical protein
MEKTIGLDFMLTFILTPLAATMVIKNRKENLHNLLNRGEGAATPGLC